MSGRLRCQKRSVLNFFLLVTGKTTNDDISLLEQHMTLARCCIGDIVTFLFFLRCSSLFAVFDVSRRRYELRPFTLINYKLEAHNYEDGGFLR